MLKQPISRSQRSKGFKVKHAVHVFMLAAICVWLLYQVKHSHDKKIAMEMSNKLAASTMGEDGSGVSDGGNVLRFGRKDLPNVHVETDGRGGSDDSHEEDGGAEEVEETEHDEDNKQEESEEEDGREDGDDEIDENDRQRGDEEAEQVEEWAEEDEEKEKLQHEEDRLLDGDDHDLDREHAEANSQEAREVHYKEDDAASAVVKENETTESEIEHTGGEGWEIEQIENGGQPKHGEGGQMENRGQTEDDGQIVDGEKRTGEATQRVEAESAKSSSAVTGQGAENTDAHVVHEDNRVEQVGGTYPNATGKILVKHDDQVGDAGSSNSTVVGSNDQAEAQIKSTAEASSNSTVASAGNSAENSTMVVDVLDGSWQLQNETRRPRLSMDQNSTSDTLTDVDEKYFGGTAEKGDDRLKQEQAVTEQIGKKGATNAAKGQEQEQEIPKTSSTGENVDIVLPAESVDSTAKPDAVTDEKNDARADLFTQPGMQTDARRVGDIAAE